MALLLYRLYILLRAVHSHVPARPAARPIFSYKWGAAGWGEQYMFRFDWCPYDSPRRPPWTACVHFHDSYPIDVSHLNFNILCLMLLQVSISMFIPFLFASPCPIPLLSELYHNFGGKIASVKIQTQPPKKATEGSRVKVHGMQYCKKRITKQKHVVVSF